jgi:hypothetical protein
MIVAAVTAIAVLAGGGIIAFAFEFFSGPRTLDSRQDAVYPAHVVSAACSPRSLQASGGNTGRLEMSAHAPLPENSVG